MLMTPTIEAVYFLQKLAKMEITRARVILRQNGALVAPHSSTLAWKIPWTKEPGGLPSVGSHRVGHD